ncbi:Uma2 family endonuclease [Pseudanabaena catenata USMAC16]|uniref:Uma2 family endonuclease n=2 Tax=Pseudanabaena TaxID=1152 RepID=A0A9X4MB96_9CYAN|nr:Uma2 family endonuclease [Pseudanabaena catenata]MDG3497303.1 Uma2 family endonuclease [Pseudanabaena catenata USMAC16]
MIAYTKLAKIGTTHNHQSNANQKNMLAISQEPSRMSIKEYLEWEPQQDLRHEYIDGEVFAMTGGTLAHNDITLNLYRTLYPQVRSRGCRINVADVKVQVTTNSPYYYPDVVVSCDPQDLNARKFIQSPTIIAEVLSPGTSARDRGEKFTNYLTIPSLQEYLLINSDKISVERYARGEGRMWLYYPYIAGDTITLSSLEFEFAIELLYEGILF